MLSIIARASLLGTILGCTATEQSTQSAPVAPTRRYRVGFANVPPANDMALAIRSVETWSRRADAAIIHEEPPWAELLAGQSPARLAEEKYDGLVAFWRQRNLELVILVDPSNGVDRTTDADPLRRAGRSLTDPAVQSLYREWVRTLVTRYRPAAIGLAAETNLIRLAAPPALYAAIVRVVNDAARDVRTIDASVPRFVSLQVDVAWGRLQGTTTYIGAEQDYRDFAFVEWVGLSSYPYLAGFDQPAQLPDEWYVRPLGGRTLPTIITEGGWSSASNATIRSSLDTQARWITRQQQLADRLGPRFLFQLTFSDLASRTFGADPRLQPFLQLGMVDTLLAPKPALVAWDAMFARRLDR
jgi:hypothetical protein